MIYESRYLGSQFHDLRFLINGRYLFCGENSKKAVQKATSCIVKLKGIDCKALNTTLLRHTLFNIKQVGRILSFNTLTTQLYLRNPIQSADYSIL